MLLVVGVDFSGTSHRALQQAVDLAERMGGSVVLVHAAVPSPLAGKTGPIGDALMEDDAYQWQQLVPGLLADARARVKADAVARQGAAHHVILHEAETRHANLIVVGSQGRTGLKRMVLGSVAEHVLRHSKIPVVVVPA